MKNTLHTFTKRELKEISIALDNLPGNKLSNLDFASHFLHHFYTLLDVSFAYGAVIRISVFLHAKSKTSITLISASVTIL